MFPATGSTITAATESSSSGTALYGATVVSAATAAGTPGVDGIPSVSTPEPASASSESTWPW